VKKRTVRKKSSEPRGGASVETNQDKMTLAETATTEAQQAHTAAVDKFLDPEKPRGNVVESVAYNEAISSYEDWE